jgi:hypothetical protein
VTERIGLATTVLLGPLRPNPVAVAKQVLSVHALSGGRMTLGIGLGGREDDYEHAGLDTEGRGKELDAMLARIKEVWEGDKIGPHPGSLPRILVAGSGRSEDPQNGVLAYFSLGDRAEEEAQAYLTDYYAWLGDEVAGFIADSAAKDPDTVRQYVTAFERAGCQELFLFPSSNDPRQVDLLADAVGL